MSLGPGSKLGPYEIAAPIGAGGMGTVYRAHDFRTARDVAVKVAEQAFTERFSREIHVIASLNHPNIATLYDVGPDYLVMELVEGETLAERIHDFSAQRRLSNEGSRLQLWCPGWIRRRAGDTGGGRGKRFPDCRESLGPVPAIQ